MLAHLIDLSDDSVQHLSFEWTEDDGFVLDWIVHEASTWLNQPCAYVVDRCHSYNKPVPAHTIIIYSETRL